MGQFAGGGDYPTIVMDILLGGTSGMKHHETWTYLNTYSNQALTKEFGNNFLSRNLSK